MNTESGNGEYTPGNLDGRFEVDPTAPLTGRTNRNAHFGSASSKGALIINADDWGQTPEITDRILDCRANGTVSSVSAMLFMRDSERAAALAKESGLDVGIHLNFTTGFSGSNLPEGLKEHHQKVMAYLLAHSMARVLFHPGLTRSFEYVVSAQLEEYFRLYGAQPTRLDGHHHQHLCANVIFGGLLPSGTIARRNFTFRQGEKSLLNRAYRKAIDSVLVRRHRITDYLFLLPPIEPIARLEQVFALAGDRVVELETHPINPREHAFLAGGEIFRWLKGLQIAPRFITRGEKAFTETASAH
jgi:chitin disaccharide deacetylase